MATSPNFGWTEPDDTSLVKDGAAAMRTLGNAIDASMADLLGGTTGQILSKASNTNMDFTWVTNDVGDITAVTAGTGISGGGTSGAVTITNSMATAIDAKGDLIGGTGADAFSRLAVGTNNQVLTADSTASTGLAWRTQAAYSTFNPTLVQSGTVTNTNNQGGYAEIGNFIHWYGKITVTGTGTANNPILFNGLPVNWATGVNPEFSGIIQLYDTSAGVYYYCQAYFQNAAYTMGLVQMNGTFPGFLGSAGSQFSGAIDNGDVITWSVTYRKA